MNTNTLQGIMQIIHHTLKPNNQGGDVIFPERLLLPLVLYLRQTEMPHLVDTHSRSLFWGLNLFTKHFTFTIHWHQPSLKNDRGSEMSDLSWKWLCIHSQLVFQVQRDLNPRFQRSKLNRWQLVQWCNVFHHCLVATRFCFQFRGSRPLCVDCSSFLPQQ